MTIAKMLNLGSGRTKFPGPRPEHHALVPENLYMYPAWLNISKNAVEQPDCVMDLFAYPWALESDTYEGALCSHLVEHIPHEIKLQSFKTERSFELEAMQDGWYAFWSELYRVLKPGAMVHVLSPYGWSNGGITDPTHTRYLTEHTFTHSMQPDPNSPFEYATGGINFRMVAQNFNITSMFHHLIPTPGDTPEQATAKNAELQMAFMTRVNVAYEIYVKLECVK